MNVLVVDDDREIVDSISIFLSGEGYKALKYKRSVPDFEIDKKEYAPDIDTVLHTDLGVFTEYGPKFPEWFKLHDYQDEAITEWQKRDYRGIFDMATGTGKTYTGLGALTTLSKNIDHAEGNRVAFAGSMNESATAMTLNYETIDVFCSWKGEEDRVVAKENAFASIWNDTEPNIKIIEFPELKQEIIEDGIG